MLDKLLTIDRRPLPAAVIYLGLLAVILTVWIPHILGSRIGEPLFDALFLIASLALVWRSGLRVGALLAVQLFWIGYLAVGVLLAVVLRGVNPLDFAQAYKFVWYLVLLPPFVWAGNALEARDLRRLLNATLLMFLTVYVGKRLLGDDRPMFMAENNFELIFLALLYFSSYAAGNKPSVLQTMGLLSIIVLSGSRSAAVAGALVVMFSYDFKSKNPAKIIIGILAAVVGVALAVLIIESRTHGGLESIDRFRFLLLFLESVDGWSAGKYLIGADRLTPLPAHVCSQLAYYRMLFSYESTTTCYSVILHSFNLRVLYDHGLLITAVLLFTLLLLMRRAPASQIACVLAVILSSGLSVSSMNNVFTAMGIGLFCLGVSAKKAAEVQAAARDPSNAGRICDYRDSSSTQQ